MAREKVDNGFADVQAPETLPLGPFADGGNAMLELVDGTTDPGRPPIGAPPSWKGDGAGARPISGITTVGGGVSGGTCCGPETHLATQNTSVSYCLLYIITNIKTNNYVIIK